MLHPPLLDETGLSSALRWYVQGLLERSGLNIDLRIPEKFERLPGEIEIAIVRLVQECLTNVHRHSGSKTAQVHIAREGDNIEVEIADQGKAMPERRLSEVRSLRIGVGIAGMRERLRKAHGKLTIESNALGTKIRATFPAKALAKKADNESERRGVA